MVSRRTFVLGVLFLAIVLGWALGERRQSEARARADAQPPVTVDKQPVNFVQRTFDPANPPADMPPFTPGESAVCDSNFLSNVSVDGDGQQTDATDEVVTITRVKVTLQLNITIWVPNGAPQHLLDHEDGHRQISEFYYQTADQLAQRIAAAYIGKKESVSGADLNAAFNTLLQHDGSEIADEYNKELNPEPTQQRYDLITDYSRNGVSASDAVAQALKDVSPSAPPAQD